MVEQKDKSGYTGYDYLRRDGKLQIAEFIDKRKLNVRKPKI